MPIDKLRKAYEKERSIPSDFATGERIRKFLARTGLTQSEFAELMGFSPAALSQFLNGKYSGETIRFRADAHTIMDRHENAEQNRLNRPHYQTRAFLEVRTAAMNALRNGVAYIVDGPPGTEKTESFRRIEREVNTGGAGLVLYVYTRANHSPKQFLTELCAAAGIPNHGLIDQLIRKLRFFLATGRVLLIVDEAQHLGNDALEVLRQLLDLPPYFGVMLGGSHDLTTRLQHWQMEQWRSRVRKSILMTGPTDAECREILRAEYDPDLSDEDCNSIIHACRATSQRVEMVKGKAVTRQFTYTSARDLFSAIEVAQQTMRDTPNDVPASRKESAA